MPIFSKLSLIDDIGNLYLVWNGSRLKKFKFNLFDFLGFNKCKKSKFDILLEQGEVKVNEDFTLVTMVQKIEKLMAVSAVLIEESNQNHQKVLTKAKQLYL